MRPRQIHGDKLKRPRRLSGRDEDLGGGAFDRLRSAHPAQYLLRVTSHHRGGRSGTPGHVEDGLREAAGRGHACKRPPQGAGVLCERWPHDGRGTGGRDACGEFEACTCHPESKAHGQEPRNHSSRLAVLCKPTLRGGLDGDLRFLTPVDETTGGRPFFLASAAVPWTGILFLCLKSPLCFPERSVLR